MQADCVAPPPPAPQTPTIGRWTAALHVFVLASFSLVQPLFDRMSHNLPYLQDQRVGRAAIALFVLILCVLVPGILVVVELAIGLIGDRAHRSVHAVILFLFLLALACPVLQRAISLPGFVLAGLALVVSTVVTIVYIRFADARLLVTCASPALLIFPFVFVFDSPVTSLIFPKTTADPVEVAVRHSVPVVFVVFDEFCGTTLWDEEGQIDAARYPNFAELARGATWYRNATSVYPRTAIAVPAILTGQNPRGAGRPSIAADAPNLFTLLAATNKYEMAVFEPFTRLFPEESEAKVVATESVWRKAATLLSDSPVVLLHTVTPLDWRMAMPRLPRRWFRVADTVAGLREKRRGLVRYPWNARRDEQFEHFLDCITPSDTPTLYFCHAVLPHSPWCYLPSGRRHTADNDQEWRPFGAYSENNETWAGDPLAVAQGQQQYLLQVGFVDRLLGKLVARLKVSGLYDSCLLVVTADHGVAFQPGRSRRMPADATLAEIMSVPLVIKLPNQTAGTVSDRNVESIDVLPTIADVLGLELDSKTDGRSLLDTARPERQQKTMHSDTRRFTIDAAFEARFAVARQMLDSFRAGSTPDGLFAIGPHAELVGRKLRELDVASESGVSIQLMRGPGRVLVDSDDLVPCLLEGIVITDNRTKLPVELAIAVGGTIRTVTRTYLLTDSPKTWTAMLPEHLFARGGAGGDEIRRSLEIFVISTSGDGITLQGPLELKYDR